MKLTDLIPYAELRESMFDLALDDYNPTDRSGQLYMYDFELDTLIPNSLPIYAKYSCVDAYNLGEGNVAIKQWVRWKDYLINLDYFEEDDYLDISVKDFSETTVDDILKSFLDAITVYHISDVQTILASTKNLRIIQKIAQATDPENWKIILHTMIDNLTVERKPDTQK